MSEAIVEFSDRTYVEASLSQIAVRSRIPKGSFYQYFDDKLDLYRWLLMEEAPRRKREFIGASAPGGEFWGRLEHHIERGMAFLVEHPRLARLTAAAADPTAIPEVRGLHKSICEAGLSELRALLEEGLGAGAIRAPGRDLEVATRLVSTIIGPGLMELVLQELGAELHEVLASDALRRRLGPVRRRRLAAQAIQFIRGGLGTGAPRASTRKRHP
ncbi:TetR/AcrR family transcriptional regulator [Myxococcus stipitatus]|uniref:TetR/AcrR family transcriptional regulator n=1 Tax=Myxococcus stipitatus TaxID=83455 RepID=UPI001F291009|nr:TetR/AcrR family transcriptional regulator [Myxococcus stipitatus]MCE9671477.1 TetR/AcrR family transcriptional regulator [Myxococcus stipitatus]